MGPLLGLSVPQALSASLSFSVPHLASLCLPVPDWTSFGLFVSLCASLGLFFASLIGLLIKLRRQNEAEMKRPNEPTERPKEVAIRRLNEGEMKRPNEAHRG